MSLKNLIALQQKKNQGAKDAKSTSSGAADDAVQDAESNSAGSPVDGQTSEQLPSAEASAPAPAAEGSKPKGLGLNLVGRGSGVGGGDSQRTPTRVPDKSPSGGITSAESESDDGAVFGLADLAGFDASDESAPTRSALSSGFEDEIEATAPDRPLDPSLTVQQRAFIESLDGIYPVLHDADLFGQAVRTIMLELQEFPEYKKLIADQDVHTMIRGMRNTMGLARIRKLEKSRKTGTVGKRAAKGKSAVSDEDMALLDSLMGGFDG